MVMRKLLSGILFTVCASTAFASRATPANGDESHCADIGFSAFDPHRVDAFFSAYSATTFRFADNKRAAVLDERLKDSKLTLADKIEVLKRLSPRNSTTLGSEEARIERLILSVPPQQLTALKYTVDYDGDYKDMEEYVFHDVDNKSRQQAMLAHFSEDSTVRGVKVLTDVDDTLYANLVDKRYPKGTFYPGVLAFYAALAEEPFATPATPITTLSARPNPVGGFLEEDSIRGLTEKSGQLLCPTALSGKTISSFIGTLQTIKRVNSEATKSDAHHYEEDEIGRVKFANFAAYSQIYPEYHFVFVGDSGQADALTAAKMVSDTAVAGTDRVLTTFIHDLSNSPQDTKRASHSFRTLDDRLKVTITSADAKGVIAFRNYIVAATVAYAHGAKLDKLITTEELGTIVETALEDLANIAFTAEHTGKQRLFEEYQQDAKTAIIVLESRNAPGSSLAINKIRKAVDGIRKKLTAGIHVRAAGWPFSDRIPSVDTIDPSTPHRQSPDIRRFASPSGG